MRPVLEGRTGRRRSVNNLIQIEKWVRNGNIKKDKNTNIGNKNVWKQIFRGASAGVKPRKFSLTLKCHGNHFMLIKNVFQKTICANLSKFHCFDKWLPCTTVTMWKYIFLPLVLWQITEKVIRDLTNQKWLCIVVSWFVVTKWGSIANISSDFWCIESCKSLNYSCLLHIT